MFKKRWKEQKLVFHAVFRIFSNKNLSTFDVTIANLF